MKEKLIPSIFLQSVRQANGNVLVYHRILGGCVILSASDFDTLVSGEKNLLSDPVLKTLEDLGLLVFTETDETLSIDTLFESKKLGVRAGDNLRCLELSVSETCNFRCTYCTFWRNKAESGVSVMKPELAIAIVKDFLASLPVKPEIHQSPLIYFGTGEPLLNWKVITRVVEFVRGLSEGDVIKLSLITNGSLVTKEKLSFLGKHAVSLGMSLDGPPDIQRSQRPAISPRIDSGKVVLDALVMAREMDFQFSCLSATYDSLGFEKHAKYVLDLCHEFGIPEFDLDYDIDSLNEHSDIEGISEEILAGYYAARALGIGVFGYWIVPYENIVQKKKKVPEFCQNYTGESVCITPKGEFKLCGYEPVSIGKFPNIKAALESEVYSQKILLNETGIDAACTGCELEGVCAGQCPISSRKTASWEAGCNLYRVITRKLLQNHLD